jgi:hypothetical protein
MSALPARAPQDDGQRAGSVAAAEWARLQAAAPQAVATIHRYLRQLGTFLAPGSVTAAENALRQFARWLVTETQITAISDVGRDDIEDYKVWLAGKRRSAGQVISRETHRQRMRTVRQFSGTDHRVGLARRAAAQPGHRRGHPQEARAAAEVPRRPRRRQADGRGPGQH